MWSHKTIWKTLRIKQLASLQPHFRTLLSLYPSPSRSLCVSISLVLVNCLSLSCDYSEKCNSFAFNAPTIIIDYGNFDKASICCLLFCTPKICWLILPWKPFWVDFVLFLSLVRFELCSMLYIGCMFVKLMKWEMKSAHWC